jgi:hypothetical protein
MLSRLRWYTLKYPHDEFDLVSRILDRPLTSSATFGFLALDGAEGEDKFRFLWRTKVVVTRISEDGSPSYEQIESVAFKDFAILTINTNRYLRVENPGRNMRDLLNALESLVGFGFVSEPLKFDKTKPQALFERIESAKLVGLKVVGAVVDDDLVARMEFASKQGMSIENMRLLKDLQYVVDSANFELIHKGLRGQVAFSANGVVKVSGQLAPHLVHLIEADLPYLASR